MNPEALILALKAKDEDLGGSAKRIRAARVMRALKEENAEELASALWGEDDAEEDDDEVA